MEIKIPALIDIMQNKKKLEVPEIRVWCHPHKVGLPGDDYYIPFQSFEGAMKFIKTYKGAERVPLLAFRGYEINLFELKEYKKRKMKAYNKAIKKGKKKNG